MGTRKKVVPFKEEEAYVMEVAGAGVKVGQKVATESSRQILVATTWRSGSTFLGDLLNHNPGVFYYFEPLHYYSQMTKEEKAENQEPEDFLRSLYTCSFTSRNVGFLHHVAASQQVPLEEPQQAAVELLRQPAAQGDDVPYARVPEQNLPPLPNPPDQDCQVARGQGGAAAAGPCHGSQGGDAGPRPEGSLQLEEQRASDDMVQAGHVRQSNHRLSRPPRRHRSCR